MQATKRQLVAVLALNGFTYWGDFLDLQVLPSNNVVSSFPGRRFKDTILTWIVAECVRVATT